MINWQIMVQSVNVCNPLNETDQKKKIYEKSKNQKKENKNKNRNNDFLSKRKQKKEGKTNYFYLMPPL